MAPHTRFLTVPRRQAVAGNREADFHGQKRSNETHASTTDPEARLYRKGPGKEAKLCFMGHPLMENRNGLVIDACLTEANGHAERIAALHMIEPRADRPRPIMLGAGQAYDAEDFVNDLRSMNATPHVANTNRRSSAIDGRTTRHAGNAVRNLVFGAIARCRLRATWRVATGYCASEATSGAGGSVACLLWRAKSISLDEYSGTREAFSVIMRTVCKYLRD